MNTKFIAGSALTGLVLAGGVAGLVSAQTVADETGLTEDQVIEIALMEVAGEVTEVELERRRGQQMYEVEILAADGVEMEIMIAADTGEILRVTAEGEGCNKDRGGDDEDGTEDA